MENIQLLAGVIVSFTSGGLAGAIANIVFSKAKDKREIALRAIDYFFSIYTDIGIAKGILAAPASLANVNNLVVVRRVGDWFHLVASLCDEGTADRNLLDKVGIVNELKHFRDAVRVAKAQATALESAWSWWPNLDSFNEK